MGSAAHGALCARSTGTAREPAGRAMGRWCTRPECETRAMDTLALVQARMASVMYRIQMLPQCARPREDE